MRKLFLFAAAVALVATSASSSLTISKAAGNTGGLYADFPPYPKMLNPVRIGIAPRSSLSRFAVWAPAFVFVNAQPVFQLHPQTIYTISGGRIVEPGGRSFALPMDQRAHVTARDFRIWANNKWYRGGLELVNFGSKVSVFNLLDMEEYLLGVVPSEMPASWHLEALKAQAVAARSYAFAHTGNGSKWKSEGYDLKPDVSDQAYKGLAVEQPKTLRAVLDTRGLILKDSGRVKSGFYRATVGETAEENYNYRTAKIPKSTLEKLTGVPNALGVTVKRFDASGNATHIQVMGPKHTREIDGIELARRLGFSTAGILDIREEGSNWFFVYRGPGNGARGLSQNGANQLANNGWLFHQILQQYYQDPSGRLQLDFMPPYGRSVAAQPSI